VIRRIARWLLRRELDERIAKEREVAWDEGHAEGTNEGWMTGFDEGTASGRAEALEHIADTVRSLLKSGHMTFLSRSDGDMPVAFTRPREPFHQLATEVQMSDAPVLAEPVNHKLLESNPDWCERMGLDPEAIQATLSSEAWAKARAIDQLLPKLTRLIDAKMSDREVVPGRRRYLVAVSVQHTDEP